jgi:uncharacterized MAPEG superfamily protein
VPLSRPYRHRIQFKSSILIVQETPSHLSYHNLKSKSNPNKMDFLPNLTTTNISLYTIPAAYILAIAPHFYSIATYESTTSKKFDNRHPRSLPHQLEADQALDKATKQRILRAEAAQQNGFENLGLFASAVVAANVAGVNTKLVNILSGGYCATRALYNVVYVNNTTPAIANVRSLTYLAGVGMIMTMFVAAGNAVNRLKL